MTLYCVNVKKCEGRTLCMPSMKVVDYVCTHSAFMQVYISKHCAQLNIRNMECAVL